MFADDTFYCSAKSGFIPGPNSGIYASTVETQLRQTMRNLLDGLEEAGLTFANVVATNVYLDDIERLREDEQDLRGVLLRRAADADDGSAVSTRRTKGQRSRIVGLRWNRFR